MPLFNRNEPSPVPPGMPVPDPWKPALDAVLRAGEIAASAASPEESLHSIARLAVDLLGAREASVLAYDADRDRLVLLAGVNLPSGIPVGHQQVAAASPAHRTLITGRPLVFGDVDHEQLLGLQGRSRAITSTVVVPIRSGGRVIGLMGLAITDSPASFTEDDMRLASTFADQAATVLFRSSSHEAETATARALEELVQASASLGPGQDLDQTLHQVLNAGMSVTRSPEGFACLLEPSGSMSRGVFRGIEKEEIRALMAHEVVRDATDSFRVRFTEGRAAVALGLRVDEQTKAVLVLRSPGPHLRADLLEVLRDRCASALAAAIHHLAAEEAQAQLISIINGVPHPILLVDDQRRLVSANPAAETIFGISSMFAAGDPIQGRLGNERIEALLLANGKMLEEFVMGSPPRTFKLRLNDITAAGTQLGRVLVMEDVTVERATAQTQRDFVSMIGHELRTPLTLVKGFARTLLKRAEKGTLAESDARDALATIDARAGQLERLIEDLLYVSKIETREATLRMEEVDIAGLVQAAIEDLRLDHPDRDIRVDIAEETQWRCDEIKVGLVIRHLIENALKYSEAPSPVEVRARPEEEELLIEVVDKGIGILSSDLPHIFERFKQLDSSSTRAVGGTGVGLYLCSQLIEMHDGRIWADSTWGKGSTFHVSLPRPPETAGSLTGSTSSSVAG